MQMHFAYYIDVRSRTIYLVEHKVPRTCAPGGESYVLLEPGGTSFTITRPEEVFITGVCNAPAILAAQFADTFQNHYTRHVPVRDTICGTPEEIVCLIESELAEYVRTEEHAWNAVAQQLTSHKP